MFASLLSISLGAILINNFIFSQFLGCCPFLGVSQKVDTAVGMGLAVTFVMGLASALYSPAMSQDAIRTAIDVLEGGHPESVVVIPTTIVSADNVADYLDPENTVY